MFEKMKQEDYHEFRASLGYIVRLRLVLATKCETVSKTSNK